jgi:subtilisin family serine protease
MKLNGIFFGVASILLALSASESGVAASNDASRSAAVFQFQDEDNLQVITQKLPSQLGAQLRRVQFGLTGLQITQLRDLSGGQVNLAGIYALDQPDSKIHGQLETLPEFKGWLYSNIGPPAIIEDPALANEYWIRELNVKEAWQHATGKGVTVADCDAGYYVTEADIRPNLILEQAYDLADQDNRLRVDDGGFVYHGTAVAAIFSGVLDGNGTNGIAFDSKLVPLQNFNYDPALDDIDKEEATAQCILRAIQIPDVRVIILENQTYGSSETYLGTREAVKLALQSGITIVSAAGNNTHELTDEEKNDTGSIIVGALEANGATADFSNYGKRVSIAAFGRGLLTLYGPEGKMGSFGGTSGATPQVAAAVALMLEANPQLTPAQIKKILIRTRHTEAKNKTVGGQLNVLKAVVEAKKVEPDSLDLARAREFREHAQQILGQ